MIHHVQNSFVNQQKRVRPFDVLYYLYLPPADPPLEHFKLNETIDGSPVTMPVRSHDITPVNSHDISPVSFISPDSSSSVTPLTVPVSSPPDLVSSPPDIAITPDLVSSPPDVIPVDLPFDAEFLMDFRNAVEMNCFELSAEGVGGTYFVHTRRGKKFAVFKVSDEEAGCDENPKHEFVARLQGVPSGEGYLREVAAYMLDHEHRARVPFTMMVEENFNGKIKKGSLQKYLTNDGSMVDFGNSRVDSGNVHNIAQLDIRLYNIDRNEENLLVILRDNKDEIFPIDHGYSIPNVLGGANFNWMNWKQAKEKYSQDFVNYVNRIDIEKDANILRNLGISEDSIEIMKLSTLILKRGVSVGWNLYQIGLFLTRNDENISQIEMVVQKAKKGRDFWKEVNEILEEFI